MPSDLLERLRRLIGETALPDLTALDPTDERHVVRAGRLLVRRLASTGDLATYELLVDVSSSRLSQIATRVARDAGLANDPRELVAAWFEHLFSGGAASCAEAPGYLDHAADWMSWHAESLVRDMALSELDDVAVSPDSTGTHEEIRERAISIAFHRLSLPDRRALLTLQARGFQPDDAADDLGLSASESSALLVEAMDRMNRTLERVEGGERYRRRIARQLGEMARRCLFLAGSPGASHTRWFVDPLPVQSLYDEYARLEEGTGFVPDGERIPRVDPVGQQAIERGFACLDAIARLGCETTMDRYLRYYILASSGAVEEAAERMERLAQGRIAATTAAVIREGRQSLLIELGRFQETASLGQTLLRWNERRPDAAYNMLAAQSWMDRPPSEFLETARRFRHAVADVEDRTFYTNLIASESIAIGEGFLLDPVEVVGQLTPREWVAS